MRLAPPTRRRAPRSTAPACIASAIPRCTPRSCKVLAASGSSCGAFYSLHARNRRRAPATRAAAVRRRVGVRRERRARRRRGAGSFFGAIALHHTINTGGRRRDCFLLSCLFLRRKSARWCRRRNDLLCPQRRRPVCANFKFKQKKSSRFVAVRAAACTRLRALRRCVALSMHCYFFGRRRSLRCPFSRLCGFHKNVDNGRVAGRIHAVFGHADTL